MFQYSDLSYPFCYLPLSSDLEDFGNTIDTVISVDGTSPGDFSTRDGWLTLNGSDNFLKIPHSAAVESLFKVDIGACWLAIKLNITLPVTTADTLFSGSLGNHADGKGIRLDLKITQGSLVVYINNSVSQIFTTSTTNAIFADGNDHTLCALFDVANNDVNIWLDGHTADGSRKAMNQEEVGFLLVTGTEGDVVIGARQKANPVGSYDRHCAGEIRQFGWINFGVDVPDYIQMNKEARDFHQGAMFGSHFK